MRYTILLLVSLSSLLLKENAVAADKLPYVVYLGEPPKLPVGGNQLLHHAGVVKSQLELLGSVLGTLKAAEDAIFYSYTQYINGFAATFDNETADKISKLPGVVSVFPSRSHQLHTTRSWQFLGLESSNGSVSADSLWSKAQYGKDTIIGTLDTGVWPESESFSDKGMGDIPKGWKGICQNEFDANFTCNKKLIGARYFNKGYQAILKQRGFKGSLNISYETPRDVDGHGTHTLSTAGGAFVANASLFGYGNGIAKGGSPLARVASYKVCWPAVDKNNSGGCFDADIIAAFEAAIADGVHVLSVSVGGDPEDYVSDGIALGSFFAVKNGIKVVCSAGNDGPTAGTVSNVAPWIFTVAASTMDREFPAYVSFSDSTVKGQSFSTATLAEGKYRIISAADAKASNSTANDAQLCLLGSLDSSKVNGAIVVCASGKNRPFEKGLAVQQAGGVGMVLINGPSVGNSIRANSHILPATDITIIDGQLLLSYVRQNSTPIGYITKPETVIDTKPAPFMAHFSSQGPNTVTPGIMKPDITAPGFSVIAAYTEATSPTDLDLDKRRVKFNALSGTSMSCPHISGVVGLLHTLHPDWSPAAIRSAIMTTALITDNKGQNILDAFFATATPFSYGSGHVNPNAAADPGLIYDLNTTNYLDFLCSIGYSSSKLSLFDRNYKCPSKRQAIRDLNYPSFTILNPTGSITVSRVVKNVGPAGTYTVTVTEPSGIRVKVVPDSLKFAVGEEKTFQVTFGVDTPKSGYVFGSITWSDGTRYVRSPVVVGTKV